jgi:transposase
LQERRGYIEEHGVSERTIRNYLRRYRERGAEALLFYKQKGPSSPRVHDRRLREKEFSFPIYHFRF